jgi:hypothetical protein
VSQSPYAPPAAIDARAELMAFHLGSTVVLLLEPPVALEELTPGAEVRLGSVLARFRA